MTYEPLEDVVLTHDIPEHGLKAGDLGTVVHVYDSRGVEVEFGTVSGETTAVLTLKADEVRRPGGDDFYAVRPFGIPTPR